MYCCMAWGFNCFFGASLDPLLRLLALFCCSNIRCLRRICLFISSSSASANLLASPPVLLKWWLNISKLLAEWSETIYCPVALFLTSLLEPTSMSGSCFPVFWTFFADFPTLGALFYLTLGSAWLWLCCTIELLAYWTVICPLATLFLLPSELLSLFLNDRVFLWAAALESEQVERLTLSSCLCSYTVILPLAVFLAPDFSMRFC